MKQLLLVEGKVARQKNPLAAYMMSMEDDRKKRIIPAKEALEVTKPHLKKVGLEESRIPNFLKDLQDCSGVFLEKEAGIWSFAHLTFQEYLCAKHWHETGEAAAWTQIKWKSLIVDSWWHETLRLYAAQANATPLVNACLEMNTIDSLTLAADMEEEALELEKPVRETLNARLEQDLESDDPDRFRLAAEVLLNRRLKKSFYSIDDIRSIDTTLITCAEYQLFIDHMRSQKEYHQPDHWTEFHFSKGQALEPIAGIRFKDAEAFCQWLSQKQGQTFRLPGREETKTYLEDSETFPGFWEKEGDVVGLPPGKEMEFLKELAQNTKFPPPCSLTLAFDLDFAFDLDLNLARAIAVNRDRDRALDRTHTFIKEINIDLFSKVEKALQANNIDQARDSIEEILSIDLPVNERRWAMLISDTLYMAKANTFVEYKRASRNFYIDFLECIYDELQWLGKIERPWWKPWCRFRRSIFDAEKLKKYALDVYWFLRIVQAREEGKLPAWEGIRLVREFESA